MKQNALVFFFLRLSLAFAFFYAGFGALTAPQNWIDYLPQFLAQIMPLATILMLFGICEIVLALWLLWGKWLVVSASIAFLMLVGIIAFNTTVLTITFRDISLAIVALALAISAYHSRGTK